MLTTLSRADVPLRTVQDISRHSNQLQAYLEVHTGDKDKAFELVKLGTNCSSRRCKFVLFFLLLEPDYPVFRHQWGNHVGHLLTYS